MNEQQQQQHGERYRESKEWENLGIEKGKGIGSTSPPVVDLIPDFWIFDYGF